MNDCTHTQDALMQGAALSDADQAHLESCPVCVEFAELLDVIPPLELLEPSAPVDSQVRHAADTMRLNRRQSRRIVLTILAACLAFGMVLIYTRAAKAPSIDPGFEQPIVINEQPQPKEPAESAGQITEAHIAAALNWDDDVDDALLGLDAELAFDEYAEFYAALAALE